MSHIDLLPSTDDFATFRVRNPARRGHSGGMPLSAVPEVQTVTIHGHRRAFVRVGRGPAVVLLHGVGHDHRTWLPVLRPLSRHFTVIAPDLLGHGSSDAPRADYSIGGYANGVRDLLAINGIQSATVIGNSLGGGIAMQFAYQFPQWTERLVLVGSGGLGRSVSPLLRALTMPGGNVALKTVTLPPVRIPAAALMRRLHDAGIRGTTDFKGLAEVYDALGNTPRRRAFHHVLQAAVDLHGDLGRAGFGDPGQTRLCGPRRPAWFATRGHPARRALPAGGRPRAFRECGHRLHPGHQAGEVRGPQVGAGSGRRAAAAQVLGQATAAPGGQ